MLTIVVLVSGGGTNLQALINAEKDGKIQNGRICCVISSKPGAYALERAQQNGIKTRVFKPEGISDVASYSQAVLADPQEEQGT